MNHNHYKKHLNDKSYFNTRYPNHPFKKNISPLFNDYEKMHDKVSPSFTERSVLNKIRNNKTVFENHYDLPLYDPSIEASTNPLTGQVFSKFDPSLGHPNDNVIPYQYYKLKNRRKNEVDTKALEKKAKKTQSLTKIPFAINDNENQLNTSNNIKMNMKIFIFFIVLFILFLKL